MEKLWFEDYDNATAFHTLRDALAPLGFVDTTWRNDACPSLGWAEDLEESGEIEIRVWIEYYDPEKRESYGFGEADLADDIYVDFGGFAEPFKSWREVRDIVAQCRMAQKVKLGQVA